MAAQVCLPDCRNVRDSTGTFRFADAGRRSGRLWVRPIVDQAGCRADSNRWFLPGERHGRWGVGLSGRFYLRSWHQNRKQMKRRVGRADQVAGFAMFGFKLDLESATGLPLGIRGFR